MKLAEERIRRLFELADRRIDEEKKELADRYVALALRISERTNLSIPSELKERYCKNCRSFLRPGKNCTVRILSDKRKKTVRCNSCGAARSRGY